jgi:outer membrane protein OmpA-like peptidoglycan-associated protein
MASKKFTLLIGLLCLFISYTNAQVGSSSYDVRDSSLIPTSRLSQHNEFLNNAYPFPAKPRNEWEIGLKGGLTEGITDVKNWGPTGGFGVHVRKALGYVFSIRAEYDWIRLRGLDWQPTQAWGKNPILTQYYAPTDFLFYNYRSTVHELTIQGVANLTNINFHKARQKMQVYLFGGIGAFTYSTFYKTLNPQGQPYDYTQILTDFGPNQSQFTYANRSKIKSELKSLLTGQWNTLGERPNNGPTLGGAPLGIVGVGGIGIEYKLTDRFNLALEDKITFTTSDLVDGQQWQNNYTPTAVESIASTKSADAYNMLSIGINYNIGKHAVEPLWWINPLDYAYNEINAPRHMKLPKPVLDDADGDGVTDQFDLEPNTPKGCPVDTHGVSRDTDGDGVPDCKDKELITPTQCQPVDADGVGKCPDPQCCKDLKAALDSGNFGGGGRCHVGDLPSIHFAGRAVKLTKDDETLLTGTADKLRNSPNCKIAVVGYGESSKAAQQLSWDRVNAVINYLVEKQGISSDRFIFRYGQSGGDENTVDLKDGTGEEGPNAVPAPHPNLRHR